MTGTTIETQLADALAEATRLRDHNANLLSEKKQLARVYAKLQDDHGTATATLHRLQLDGPVEALIADIAIDPKLFSALFAEHHKFALDEEGRPCVQNLEGQPVLVKDKNGREAPLAFEAEAIAAYLCPRDAKADDIDAKRWGRVLAGNNASGGGASGGRGTRPAEAKPAPVPETPQVQRAQFGLR